MKKESRLQSVLGLAKDLFLMVWCLGSLAAWAVGKTIQVKALRLIGRRVKATKVEGEADQAFRALCGVPEPGEAWDC